LVEILQSTPTVDARWPAKAWTRHSWHITKQHESELTAIDGQRRKLEDQRSQMQLALILTKKQLASLKDQVAETQTKADKLGEQITGISANQLDEANTRSQRLKSGRMILLAEHFAATVVRDWTARMVRHGSGVDGDGYRRFQSDQADNRGFWRVLVRPDGAAIRLRVARQSDSPQVQLARFATGARAGRTHPRTLFARSAQDQTGRLNGADQTEIVRMLTLRIQQTCHRPGIGRAVSSLDRTFPPCRSW